MTATPLDARPLLIERLLDPAAYPHPTAAIRLVETHISWVLLTGPFAYKLKKPVNLDFLDFTTLERRKRSCEEEVRVSGRFAADLYVGTVPITGSAQTPCVGGVGEPIEWAVQLVQFDEAERLDNRFAVGRLTAGDCRDLGAAIAAVEERLPVAQAGSHWGTAASVLGPAAINLAAIRRHLPECAPRADRLESWLSEQLSALAPVLLARQVAGRVRECHGDLHLANLVCHQGRMTAFDAIDFSENLRWIDVANDIAFLVMDLESRGRFDLAAQVVSSWIEAADDHAALVLLPIYEVYRAIVRASIEAIRCGQGEAAARGQAARYLDLADRLTSRGRPVMVATSGVSGSGKSTVAGELVGTLAAIRLRSDVERKRIAGLAPTDRPAGEAATAALYDESFTRRVYERLAALARTALAAGRSVVVDAACTRRWQRDLLATVAAAGDAPLVWLEFDVPAEAVLARVAAREALGTDPSDASCEVIRQQVASREPIGSEELGPGATLLVHVADGDPAAVATAVAVQCGHLRPTGSDR